MSHYVKDSESQKSIARIMKTKVQPLLGKKYSEGADISEPTAKSLEFRSS